MFKQIVTVAVFVATAAVVGCDKDQPTPAPTPQAQAPAASALPASLIATAAPQGAKGVNEVKASAKDGDEVIVRGIIGGRPDPIAENRAVFTIIDPSVPVCGEGDACTTPWDACCEPADAIAAGSVTVQVVDASGKPLKAGLSGIGGLAPLKRVIVAGQYRPTPDGKAVAINATKLYVEP